MRHNKKFNHLGRTASHRNAMLANMAISLIMHKRITTTLAKAKALKKYVEPLITRSKDDTTNSRRVVFSYLQNKFAVTELFKVISEKVANRPGGYTRIIKLGTRQGDAAEVCFIELVDFDENMAKAPKAAKKTRRSRKAATWLRHQRLLRRLVVAVRLQLLRLQQQRHQLQRLQRHLQRSQRLNNVPDTLRLNIDSAFPRGRRYFCLIQSPLQFPSNSNVNPISSLSNVTMLERMYNGVRTKQ